MDFTGLTFLGLMGIGFVNVLGFFKPDLDSKVKFALSFLFIFVLTFVPPSLGNLLFDKMKLALEIAFSASGAYKLVTKASGK